MKIPITLLTIITAFTAATPVANPDSAVNITTPVADSEMGIQSYAASCRSCILGLDPTVVEAWLDCTCRDNAGRWQQHAQVFVSTVIGNVNGQLVWGS